MFKAKMFDCTNNFTSTYVCENHTTVCFAVLCCAVLLFTSKELR